MFKMMHNQIMTQLFLKSYTSKGDKKERESFKDAKMEVDNT